MPNSPDAGCNGGGRELGIGGGTPPGMKLGSAHPSPPTGLGGGGGAVRGIALGTDPLGDAEEADHCSILIRSMSLCTGKFRLSKI